jgi:GT2 family glycosyltransferase
MLDDDWITKFIDIYNMPELNCGILGMIPHTGSFIRNIDIESPYHKKHDNYVSEHTYVDGIQFMSMDVVKKIGHFDEKFTADCNNHDRSFASLFHGHRNYRVNLKYIHHHVDFSDKAVSNEDTLDFDRQVRRSRILLKEKWNLQLGWKSSASVYDGWKRVDGKWEIDKSKNNLHPPGYIEKLKAENLI